MKPSKVEQPVCNACGCKHFSVRLTDKDIPPEIFKPIFTCLNGSCNRSWSSGRDGKPYITYAKQIVPNVKI